MTTRSNRSSIKAATGKAAIVAADIAAAAAAADAEQATNTVVEALAEDAGLDVEAVAAFDAARLSMQSAIQSVCEGAALSEEAARLAADAGEMTGNAGQRIVAALMVPGVMAAPFTFTVVTSKGIASTMSRSFDDYVRGGNGFNKPDGKPDKLAAGAFWAHVLQWAGVNNVSEARAKAVRSTFIQKAFPAVKALQSAGVSFEYKGNGVVAVTGGEGEQAEKVREAAAKSLTALAAMGKPVDNVAAGQGKPAASEGKASEGVDLQAAYRIVKLHLAELAALALDVDGRGKSQALAPNNEQLRSVIGPIARDAAAVIAAFGTGIE